MVDLSDYDEYKDSTKDYINDVELSERKDKGQYFTPRSLQEKVFKNLPKELYEKENINILDPASGTGEFIYTASELFKDPDLYGFELDEELVDISKKVVPNADIEQANTLKKNINKKFDLIIGNPPYYEFKPDQELKNKYDEVLYGRTNIYGLFLYKSINLLRKGGYIGFIIPQGLNNGAYLKKVRKYILDKCSLEYLHLCNDNNIFKGAKQPVMILILKKTDNNKNNYVFKRGSKTIFSEDAKFLKEQFKNKYSLDDLGFYVKTGSLAWNNHKNKLTKDSSETLLIYSHNITKNGLKYKSYDDKKQFIKVDSSKINKGPAILVNRIIGNKGLKAVKIPENKEFIAENHVNVIKPEENNKININKLYKQLNKQENFKLIKNITGNSQLSKTELEELYPIKIQKQ